MEDHEGRAEEKAVRQAWQEKDLKKRQETGGQGWEEEQRRVGRARAWFRDQGTGGVAQSAVRKGLRRRSIWGEAEDQEGGAEEAGP